MKTYLKHVKGMGNWGKPIFCPVNKKMISPGVLENILVFVQFSLKLAKLPNVYGLSCSYLDFLDTLVSSLLLTAKVCSGGFNCIRGQNIFVIYIMPGCIY